MPPWTFFAFIYGAQSFPVDNWVATLEAESFNNLASSLEYLQVLYRWLWKRPMFGVLHGDEFSGMGEIIFDGDNKTYRLFGWFGPGRSQFTLLNGCAKQRSNLRREMKLARQRRDIVIANGVAYVHEFAFTRRTDS